MPLFGVNPTAEEALGAVGAVLRSIQIIPQIVKSYRTKSTHGISSAFMLAWACTQLALGPYTIVQALAIPLQIQPQAFAFFSALSWSQCLYYGSGYSMYKAAGCLVALLAVLAGAEVGSVFGLRAGRQAGTEVPVMVFGYLTWLRTFLSAPPQFYKIYQLREVVGFSFTFMLIDIVGAVFSILSLLFRPTLDVPAVVTFALVVVQNGLVIILALILNPIARRKREKESLPISRVPSTNSTIVSGDQPCTPSPCVAASEDEKEDQKRLQSSQRHKASVSSCRTLTDPTAFDLERGEKTATLDLESSEKDGPARTRTVEVGTPLSGLTPLSMTPVSGQSEASTPTGAAFGRSRASTLVDLPSLKE